jgi:hypothetical protein
MTTGCPSSGTFLALKMSIAMLVLVECPCIAKFFMEQIQRHGNKEQSNLTSSTVLNPSSFPM